MSSSHNAKIAGHWQLCIFRNDRLHVQNRNSDDSKVFEAQSCKATVYVQKLLFFCRVLPGSNYSLGAALTIDYVCCGAKLIHPFGLRIASSFESIMIY
mmetsp:Transcript_17122/g.56764  ORF Transcript_17122/g.56764 Transcript_17122/m.56764 type:complete len:98 (+) Transcript_17122:979-1272(+)